MMSDSSAKEKARRLKQLRSITGLTAKELGERNHIPLATLKSWEAASKASLTEKGAHRIVDALQNEGVDCSVAWLLHGIGAQPRLATEKEERVLADLPRKEYIVARETEIKHFYNTYKNAVIIEVEDDAMLPFYRPGDVVGGIWQHDETLHFAKQHCLVKLKNETIICRKLIQGTVDQHIHLCATNMESNAHPLMIENIQMEFIAPVIRVWAGI